MVINYFETGKDSVTGPKNNKGKLRAMSP